VSNIPGELHLAFGFVLRAQRIAINGRPRLINSKFLARAVEIYDFRADAVLTPKLASAEMTHLQRIPQSGLRARSAITQTLMILFQRFSVV